VLAAGAVADSGCARLMPRSSRTLVNDVHGQLNPTWVRRVARPTSIQAIQNELCSAARDGQVICLAGSRHSMGAQQFATDGVLLDMRGMDRVIALDRDTGQVEVEAGIQWPALIDWLVKAQGGAPGTWTIIQKQTGANLLSVGGALSSNIHSRGLAMKPIIDDVDAFTLIDAKGEPLRCSRSEHPELFRLAIGGYGLFGAIASVRLRLWRRRKMERVVTIITRDVLLDACHQRILDGFLYGDFQFAIDPDSDDFLRKGIFSCYRPVDDRTPMPEREHALSIEHWKELLYLAHTRPGRAFERYVEHYLSTSGQLYWSDEQQLSTYIDSYHAWLDQRLHAPVPATEILTEIYVPRESLADFLADVAGDFRAHRAPLIYGTIRFIERDPESFLAWAKQPYACVIFNLHTEHSRRGLQQAEAHFRRLIDRGISRGGSFYLTYHRFATRKQIETCYPQFAEFLRLKRYYDPTERFQSDWYRHVRELFADELIG